MRFYKNYPESVSYSLIGANKPTCILFAEGDAEAFFLEKWLTTIGRDPADIVVLCYRGKRLALLFGNLTIDPNFPNVQRFGFFLDAEAGNAAAKAGMVTQLLISHSVISAPHTVTAGTVLNAGAKRVALCVSPDNLNSGFIEHSVMNEIAAKPLAPCINAFEQCLLGTWHGRKPEDVSSSLHWRVESEAMRYWTRFPFRSVGCNG